MGLDNVLAVRVLENLLRMDTVMSAMVLESVLYVKGKVK